MAQDSGLVIGSPAPPVRLAAADGGTFDLAQFRGQADVLLFGMRAFT